MAILHNPRLSPLAFSPALWLSDTGTDPAVWPDLSGNGRNATQATTGSQPDIVTNVINGRQVRRFNGIDRWFDSVTVTTMGIASISVGHTIFAVIQRTAGSILCSNYNTGGGGQNVIGMASTSVTNLRAGATSTHTATAAENTAANIITHWYSGGASSRTFNGWMNGIPLTLNPTNGVFSDTATFESGLVWRIGRWGNLSSYGNGDIAEIIIYPTALTTDQRQRVENYLNSKYLIY